MRFIITLLAIVFLSSCGREPSPIPRDQLVNILTDLHIAEGLINGHHPLKLKDSLQVHYLNQVLETWNTTNAEFESALLHMHGDPDFLQAVYGDVQEKIASRSKEMDDEEQNEMEMLE